MDSNRRMTVSGTPKQIASAINSSHGGVSFAGGAVVSSAGWYNQRPATIQPGIVRMMAQGGLVGSNKNDGTNAYSEAQLQALNNVVASNEAMRADLQNFNTNLKAHVVFKEITDKQTTLNEVKKASGF
jgi:hypothetical protein